MECLGAEWGTDVKASAVDALSHIFAPGGRVAEGRVDLMVASGAIPLLLSITAESEDEELRTAGLSLMPRPP